MFQNPLDGNSAKKKLWIALQQEIYAWIIFCSLLRQKMELGCESRI